MCNPMFVMAGANLMQGVAGYQAASATEKSARAQGKILDDAAGQTEQQGLRDEEQMRQQVRQFMGGQRAAVGASGVENSGSVALLQDDAARQGEIDALTVRNNAYLEAWGMKNDARMTRYQGKLAKQQGRMTLLTSALNASAFAAGGMKPMQSTSASAGGNTVSVTYK